MTKVQTLAIALFALGSVSWATTSISSFGRTQKNPETNATNLNSSRSNIYRVKVTKVNERDKTLAVEVNFSVKKAAPLPKKEDQVDVTYTQAPPNGPLEATTIKSTKSNTSDRLRAGQHRMTGKVLGVNEKDKSFAVEVTFSAKTLSALPVVGKTYDITFTQTTPGGPLEAVNLNSSKSNAY